MCKTSTPFGNNHTIDLLVRLLTGICAKKKQNKTKQGTFNCKIYIEKDHVLIISEFALSLSQHSNVFSDNVIKCDFKL